MKNDMKKYKNRLRLAKVIVKNKTSRFYGSVCTMNQSLVFIKTGDKPQPLTVDNKIATIKRNTMNA